MKEHEKKKIDKIVSRLYGDLQATYGGLKEDYFGLYFLQKKWGLQTSDAVKQIAFGGNDFGIDGFHFDEKRKTFIIYQFKYTTDYKQFKGTYQRLVDEGMKLVFESPNQKNYNPIITALNNALTTNRPIIEQMAFHFVFLGDCEKAENSKVLDALQEDLEGKKYLIEKRFTRLIPFNIQYISIENIGSQDDKSEDTIAFNEGKIYDAVKTYVYELDVSNSIHYTGGNNETMTVCLLRLPQLYNILSDMGNRLFDRNIRYGLGGEKPVNRAIKESLRSIIESKQSPKDFLFNHNGITISAKKVDFENAKIKIVEPRILNGAQSLSTYKEFRDKNIDNPIYINNLSKLEDINILCKIIHSDDPDFIVNVTINNNRQNPVEPWALHANDLIQLSFEDKINELGIFYARQENAFENSSWDERGEKGITDDKKIEIIKLAQTFMAAEGRVHLVSNRREIFENKNYYGSVFNEQRLKADFRLIVLCYKIQKNINIYRGSVVDKGINKYASVWGARNLLWALLCQGIMNDKDITHYADEFGSNMTINNEFKDYFRHLASTKCRELISDLLEKHTNDIKNEKYGFLNTEASFIFCMEKACRKLKWEKKYLK